MCEGLALLQTLTKSLALTWLKLSQKLIESVHGLGVRNFQDLTWLNWVG
jgi:Leucine-rich repeat (LRR) protein